MAETVIYGGERCEFALTDPRCVLGDGECGCACVCRQQVTGFCLTTPQHHTAAQGLT